jgi:hypothetical protein
MGLGCDQSICVRVLSCCQRHKSIEIVYYGDKCWVCSSCRYVLERAAALAGATFGLSPKKTESARPLSRPTPDPVLFALGIGHW